MFEDLLHVVGPGQMHWRYSLRADALLLVMLPPADAQAAALLTQHYLRLVVSQLLSQLSLGLTGLLYLLRQDCEWAKVGCICLLPHLTTAGLAASLCMLSWLIQETLTSVLGIMLGVSFSRAVLALTLGSGFPLELEAVCSS